MPANLSQPAVLTGKEAYGKEVFLRTPEAGDVSHILVGWPADGRGAVLTVVGNEGAVFLDAAKKAVHTVTLSERIHSPIHLVRLNREGRFGFLNRGSWSSDVILFDENGRRLWSYGGIVGVDDSSVGDIDGDGVAEVAVGFNGGGGIHLLNIHGKIIWKKDDGNVWHVEIVDTNGDGRGEVVHSNASGELKIRDANGAVVARKRPANYISDFSLVPAGSNGPWILAPGDGAVHLMDRKADRISRLAAPGLNSLGSIAGTQVRFSAGEPHFAALIDHSTWDRSVLLVYDAGDNLVYHEILGGNCEAIVSYPGKVGESLLVGCKSVIWEYKPAPTKGPPAKSGRPPV